MLQAVNDHATAPLRAAAARAPVALLGPTGTTGLSRDWIYNSARTPPKNHEVDAQGVRAAPFKLWNPYHFIDLFMFDLISRIHFTFLVLDLVGRSLRYYDSIRDFALTERLLVSAEAKTWLQTLSSLSVDGRYGDAASWPSYVHDDGHSMPRQGYELDAGEGFDAGLCFVVNALACIAHGRLFDFSQADMRNRRRQLLATVLHANAAPDAAGEREREGHLCAVRLPSRRNLLLLPLPLYPYYYY